MSNTIWILHIIEIKIVIPTLANIVVLLTILDEKEVWLEVCIPWLPPSLQVIWSHKEGGIIAGGLQPMMEAASYIGPVGAEMPFPANFWDTRGDTPAQIPLVL